MKRGLVVVNILRHQQRPDSQKLQTGGVKHIIIKAGGGIRSMQSTTTMLRKGFSPSLKFHNKNSTHLVMRCAVFFSAPGGNRTRIRALGVPYSIH
jgi:hypothetical protein